MEQERDNGQHLDVGELQRQLDEIKKMQSGSDRRVRELSEEKEELQNEIERLKNDSTQETLKLQLAAELRAQDADRRVEVYKHAAQYGIDPEHAMKALGFTESTDEERLAMLNDYFESGYKKGRGDYLKSNGRRVQDGLLDSPGYGNLLQMTDAQIAALGGPTIDRAMKQELEIQKKTKRDRIREVK